MYDTEKVRFLVFDCGLYLGMATLFDIRSIIFLPFILAGIITMTAFKLKHLLVLLVAVILPIYFTGAIYFLFNDFYKFTEFLSYNHTIETFSFSCFSNIQLLPWTIILPLFLIAAVMLQNNFFRNNVKTRRIQLSVALFFLFAIGIFFLSGIHFMNSISYLAIPSGIVLSQLFIDDKRFMLKEVLFILLFLICIVNQIFF